jgi:MATE family multidrug resistance protein
MNKTILRLAVPNILSNISVPLLGIADTALMGRMESEVYIGAIALGSIIFNFIYWGFSFLRMGTTGMTAQAFGQNDTQESAAMLGRAMLVALLGSLLILITQVGIEWLSFVLIEGEESVKTLAREYFYIRVWAAPATLGIYAIHGWFLGMQNARYPMTVVIIVNGVNIALNFAFVLGLGMKSDGVALATVIAQYVGLFLSLWMVWGKYYSFIQLFDRQRILDVPALKRFFSVNSDIFIRTICLIFTLSFFTAKSSSLSMTVLAANQVLLQLFYTTSYGVDGFAYAAESLVGRYVGEGKSDKLKEAIKWLFIWGMGIGGVIGLIYLFFGRSILYLFTDIPEVIATATPYLGWMIAVSVTGALAFMWDGVYIGATASKAMRNSMLLATLLVFLPVYFFTFDTWQNHSLWLAMVLFMITRSVSLSIMAPRHIFSLLKK